MDGMIKFDEEGIKKLYEAFDGDLSDFTDRLDAIQKAGENYKSFGGSSEETDSSVKFIIRTDSIKSL
jgi:putative membrane protein